MGTMRVGLLIAAMTGLFLAVGYLIGAEQGMIIAFVLALGMNAFAYWNSDKMVLSMYGAKPVDRNSAPQFYALVETLAQRAQLPMPRVYIIDNPQPNAFATGRDPEHAAVAATTGLLDLLDEREIASVMAHELAHVKNRDTLIMTVTATLAAMVVQMAISRTREYGADAGGAAISGDPLALASALAKLEHGARVVPNNDAEANPATAHLFIVNPLSGRGADSLFSTHPAMANRIARLREMAGGNVARATASAPRAPRRPGPWG